jgi:hypothetical protein
MKRISLIILAGLVAAALAGCSIDHSTGRSVRYYALHQQVLSNEIAWCQKQGMPGAFLGCRHANAAANIVDMGLLRWVNKPEPWPGRDTAFFKTVAAVGKAEMALPSDKEVLIEVSEGMGYGPSDVRRAHAQIAADERAITAVPASERNAVQEERDWCETRSYLNRRTKPTPACRAASSVMVY